MRRYRAVAHIGLRPSGIPEYPAGSYLPEDYPGLERLLAIGAVVVEEADGEATATEDTPQADAVPAEAVHQPETVPDAGAKRRRRA